MRTKTALFFLLIISFWSCREDFESIVAIPQNFEPGLIEDFTRSENMVTSSLIGFVMTETRAPLANALVTLNGLSTTTDAYGHFFFIDVEMNTEGTVVSIHLEDYHNNSKLFYPIGGDTEHMDIIMSKVMSETEFNSDQSGSLMLDAAVTLDYSSNAFRDNNGELFAGIVRVSTTYQKASAENFALKSPGNFQAVDIENNLVGIAPEALLKISFSDIQGNRLNLDSESDIQLSIAGQSTDNDLEAWYYAPNFGLYTINNSIDISDQSLTLDLNHNNFILLGRSYPMQRERYQLLASNGEILENALVELRNSAGDILYTTRSNSNGMVQVLINDISDDLLNIFDACDQLVYNDTPPTNDSSIEIDEISFKTLEGDLYDCNITPVQSGVIGVQQGEEIRFEYLSSPNFQLTLQTCNQGNAMVQGFDGISLGTGGSQSAQSINIVSESALGDLFTCNDPSINELVLENLTTGETFTYTINNTAGSGETVTSFGTPIPNNNAAELQITFNGRLSGDYSNANDHQINRIFDEDSGISYSGDAAEFIVSRFGNTEKLTIGQFEGEFRNVLSSNPNEEFFLRGSFNFYFIE